MRPWMRPSPRQCARHRYFSTGLRNRGWRVSDLIARLKSCASSRDLESGRRLHNRAIQDGDASNLYVSCSLIGMYGKCGSVVEARKVFDRMPCHNAVAWNALIVGYTDNGQEFPALESFWMAMDLGVSNAVTFFVALKACSSLAAKEDGRLISATIAKLGALDQGMKIHSRIKTCIDKDIVVNSLVEMYGKCGSMVEARKVFDRSFSHSAISWTVLMLGYIANGESEIALELFSAMRDGRWQADARSFGAAFKAIASLAAREEWGECSSGKAVKVDALKKGIEIHRQASRVLDVYVGNALVDMYAKCGSMSDARRWFDRMPCHSVVSWNTLVTGYAENGEPALALQVFSSSRAVDALSYVAALKACIGLAEKEEAMSIEGKMVKAESLEKGRAIHIQVVESGNERGDYVWNTLADMYAKCGNMVEAGRVFSSMACHSLVSWTVLMVGYVENSEPEVALDLFSWMQEQGFVPDATAFAAAAKACVGLAAKEQAMKVDGKLVKRMSLEKAMSVHATSQYHGCKMDIIFASTMVDAYSRCGSLLDAQRVFDRMPLHDEVSWTSLMLAYVECGEEGFALETFQEMECKGIALTSPTLVTALKACARLAEREEPTQVDGGVVKVELLEKTMAIEFRAARLRHLDYVLASSLIEVYAKCGSLADSQRVFDRMPHSHLVLWTVLMSSYADSGEGHKVLELYAGMKLEACCAPDARVFVAALNGCGSLGTIEAARAVVRDAYRFGAEKDLVLSNTLVDVFGKVGSASDAQRWFDAATARDLVTWNALFAAYGRQGNAENVLDLFHQAVDCEGIEPDAVTLLCLLSACSHAGLVSRGRRYFEAMQWKYRVTPACEHGVCMIDMLARANKLEEAVTMVKSVNSKASAVIAWRTILAAARKWSQVEIGKLAFEALLKIDEMASAPYSLMSNLFGSDDSDES